MDDSGTNPLERFNRWLEQPVGVPLGPDEIVPLVLTRDVWEASALSQGLNRAGIRSVVLEGDAGGWAPHLGFAQGHRVMVRVEDLERATAFLDGGRPDTQ